MVILMPLSVGDKLGHFEVISLLGKGGMGDVWKARDTTLKRDVALKVLPVTFLRDPINDSSCRHPSASYF